eukprot:scaffold285038_cov33-Tisochrysis_lutea.AAC.2
MASLSLLTLSLLPAAPAAGVLSRRAVLACAPVALAAMPNAAHASAFSTELGEAEAALEASDGRSVLPAINRLLEIATEYGGMPSDELRRELIEKASARATTHALSLCSLAASACTCLAQRCSWRINLNEWAPLYSVVGPC